MMQMTTEFVNKRLFSVKEVATILGVSERSIWSITSPRGNLVPCKVGCRVLYSQAAIDRFIEQQEKEGEAI